MRRRRRRRRRATGRVVRHPSPRTSRVQSRKALAPRGPGRTPRSHTRMARTRKPQTAFQRSVGADAPAGRLRPDGEPLHEEVEVDEAYHRRAGSRPPRRPGAGGQGLGWAAVDVRGKGSGRDRPWVVTMPRGLSLTPLREDERPTGAIRAGTDGWQGYAPLAVWATAIDRGRRAPHAALQTLLGLGVQRGPTTYQQLYAVESTGPALHRLYRASVVDSLGSLSAGYQS
jgi:hypothetical protein